MIKIQNVVGKIRKHPLNKKLLLFLSLMVLLAVGSSATFAFLHEKPVEPLTNTFVAATYPTIEIKENSFDKVTKSGVCVDVGTPGYTVYVRAEVIATWQDDNGNVLGAMPKAGNDYVISYGDGWFKGTDGFWYCKSAVTGKTPNLITTCTVNNPAPNDDYHLSVEIMAQSIQAAGTVDGKPAVTDAWGVGVADNGSLTEN